MDEHYFSVELDGGRVLCLAPLTDRKIEISGQEISDPAGYFLFEKVGSDESPRVEILAQVLSDEAVERLRAAFNMT